MQLFPVLNEINPSTENFSINLNFFQKLFQHSLQFSATRTEKIMRSQQAFLDAFNPILSKTPSTLSSPDSGLDIDPINNDLSKTFCFNKPLLNSTTHSIQSTKLNGNGFMNISKFPPPGLIPENYDAMSNLDWILKNSNCF